MRRPVRARIRLIVHPENLASQWVPEKCGFRLEGTARGEWFHRGEHHDVLVYALLRDEHCFNRAFVGLLVGLALGDARRRERQAKRQGVAHPLCPRYKKGTNLADSIANRRQ